MVKGCQGKNTLMLRCNVCVTILVLNYFSSREGWVGGGTSVHFVKHALLIHHKTI